MRLKAVPFSPKHLDGFPYKAVHQGEGPDLLRRVLEAATLRPNALVCTLVREDELPVAVLGIALLHERAGEVWSVMSERVKECGIALTRLILRILDTYQRQLKLRRLQAITRTDDPGLAKFFRVLGFEYEGLMKRFGYDGSDHLMFARTRDAL